MEKEGEHRENLSLPATGERKFAGGNLKKLTEIIIICKQSRKSNKGVAETFTSRSFCAYVVEIGTDTQRFPGKAKLPKCQAMGRKGHHNEHLLSPPAPVELQLLPQCPTGGILQNKPESVGQ